MKILTFTFISLCFSLTSFGQQLFNLNGIVNTELPAGIKKISKEEALTHGSNKFENSKIALSSISNGKEGQIYKLDDIIISLYTGTKSAKPGQLFKIKKGLDGMAKQDTSFHSNIKNFNGNDVLVTRTTFGKTINCTFFSFNKENSKSISGSLEYNLVDSKEAVAVLNYILNHIDFVTN
jgi:hypothetical protein